MNIIDANLTTENPGIIPTDSKGVEKKIRYIDKLYSFLINLNFIYY